MTYPDEDENANVESLKDAIATSGEAIISGFETLSGTFSPNQKNMSRELNIQQNVQRIVTDTKRIIDTQEKEAKVGDIRYSKGLVMGLILGIIGNLFVSYLMKILEIFNIPYYGWALVTILSFFIVLVLIWLLRRG